MEKQTISIVTEVKNNKRIWTKNMTTSQLYSNVAKARFENVLDLFN